jgi:hypothetical protein
LIGIGISVYSSSPYYWIYGILGGLLSTISIGAAFHAIRTKIENIRDHRKRIREVLARHDDYAEALLALPGLIEQIYERKQLATKERTDRLLEERNEGVRGLPPRE